MHPRLALRSWIVKNLNLIFANPHSINKLDDAFFRDTGAVVPRDDFKRAINKALAGPAPRPAPRQNVSLGTCCGGDRQPYDCVDRIRRGAIPFSSRCTNLASLNAGSRTHPPAQDQLDTAAAPKP